MTNFFWNVAGYPSAKLRTSLRCVCRNRYTVSAETTPFAEQMRRTLSLNDGVAERKVSDLFYGTTRRSLRRPQFAHGLSMKLTVVLADEHAVVRAGLRTWLEEAGIQVVGEADSGDAALNAVKRLRPGVLLIEASCPDVNAPVGSFTSRPILATSWLTTTPLWAHQRQRHARRPGQSRPGPHRAGACTSNHAAAACRATTH